MDKLERSPKLNFQLANAVVGKPYAEKPVLLTLSDKVVVIEAIDVRSEAGLEFDVRTGQLVGQPLISGEFDAHISYYCLYQGVKTALTTVLVRFYINADPRSLWKNIPSDAQQLYAKVDSASQKIETATIKMLAASQRGRSHAHKGQARDDDFFIAQGENWQLSIVADGAGSAKYSRYGSQLICQTMGNFVSGLFSKSLNLTAIKQEFKAALAKTVFQLKNEAQAQQASIKDYASTVLALVCFFDTTQQQYVYLSLAVGDGVIALYQPATHQLRLLNQPDTGEYAGETCFLTEDSLVNTESLLQVFSSPVFLPYVLMTDGVSDAFFDSDNALKNASVWHAFWQDLTKNQALVDEKKLLAWLDFWSAGNHDDRTIVIVEPKNDE
ncbi:MAG: PP2C family serine/threonine-protein phosphatase [Agitococcus sp.]|nr:PP2C family serine/threonine-protein phosphatase [Agitococcus sp.]